MRALLEAGADKDARDVSVHQEAQGRRGRGRGGGASASDG